MNMQMRRFFYAQIPVWARPDNSVMRYLLRQNNARQHNLRYWLIRFIALGATGVLLLAGGSYYEEVAPAEASSIAVILYPFLLFTQFIASIGAFFIAANAFSSEQHREAWDLVRATSHGAELVMRSRWAAVFYQLRWLLLVLMLPRLFLVGHMVADLRQYNGYYLDLYISGITPTVSVEVAVLLLAAFMTAAILQPLVTIGLSAAAGLTISTISHRRQTVVFTMLTLLIIDILIFGLALWIGFSVIGADPTSNAYQSMSMQERLNSVLSMTVLGDQSLSLLHLETYFQTWADIDYGVLLGVMLLGVVLIEAAFTNGLIAWSARRASRPARE
jgi:hypothetical protein